MTDQIEFKLFTKKHGFQLTINIVVYTLFIGSIGIAYLADKLFDESTLETIGQTGGIFCCILIIYFKIAQSFTRESLQGDLKKSIILKPSEIIIDDQIFSLEEIKKIEFYVGDYFNRLEYKAQGDLNPGRTNGTSNICELHLTNGKMIDTRFQLMYKDEFLKTRRLLLEYYSKNKIHFLKLIEYLGIENYEEIQEFKKTLPPTTVITNSL
jgi:hypothetical protein